MNGNWVAGQWEGECKGCSDDYTEGQIEYFDCQCGHGTRKYHCGKDTGWRWTTQIVKDCVRQPYDERDCNVGSGTMTRSYSCVNEDWVPGQWKGGCRVCRYVKAEGATSVGVTVRPGAYGATSADVCTKGRVDAATLEGSIPYGGFMCSYVGASTGSYCDEEGQRCISNAQFQQPNSIYAGGTCWYESLVCQCKEEPYYEYSGL